MKLVLLENEKTVDFILSENSGINSDDILLCFSHFVFQKLEMKSYGGNYLLFEDLFDDKLNNSINDFCDSIATNWYLKNGKDISVYENVSIGRVVQGEFSRRCFAGIIVKYGEALRLAKQRWPAIDNIVHDFDDRLKFYFLPKEEGFLMFSKENLVSNVAEQLNISSTRLPVTRVSKKKQNYEGAGPHKIIPYFFKQVNKILVWVNNIFYHFRHNKKNQPGKIYWFSYFNQLSMFDNIDSSFILNDFYSWQYYKKHFGNVIYVHNSTRSEILCNSSDKFLEKINEYSQTLTAGVGDSSIFVYNGIDYNVFYKLMFNYLENIVFPECVLLIKRWQKIISKHHISTIIVNEEIGYANRVILLVSKTMNVKSVWVDHGMTIYSFDGVQKVFIRNLSDIVITPGSYDKVFYACIEGVNNRECIALGNPSMDTYHLSKRKKISSIKNVMLLSFEDNFYSRVDRFMFQGLFYKELFALMKEFLTLGIKIYYKPHPSEIRTDHEEYFNFFNVDINDITYAGHLPIDEVMEKIDLCVCSSSSVFFEAQANGIPTIFLEPKMVGNAVRPPLYGTQGDEVLRYQTAEEILGVVKKNMNDASPLNKFIENFNSVYAPAYVGTLDGKAAERIVAYVTNMN